jgi:hypothetical protein
MKFYTHDSSEAKRFQEQNRELLDLIFSMTEQEREQWREDQASIAYTTIKESSKQKPKLN